MSCNPGQVSELPGSNAACETLQVRKCLTVAGVEIVPGGGVSDGITITGDGSLGQPTRILAVQHDGSLAGAGTVASPLSVGVSSFLTLGAGSTAAVSAPGTSRIRYNETAGRIEVSINGAAYVAMVTL